MAGGGLALVLAVSGCSGSSGDPGEAGSGSTSPSGSASLSTTAAPTPTSSLTPAQQQAFDEATDAVLAYRQTITDLYSGARTDLNDLDAVATGELLNQGLKNISLGLMDGGRREPEGVELTLVWAQPSETALTSSPDELVIRACVDATAVTVIHPDGTRSAGVREMADYTVIRTEYLPPPGWAVSRVTGEPNAKDREC